MSIISDKHEVDDHFRRFAGVLKRQIATYGETTDWYDRQKGQMEQLVALEAEFRSLLVTDPAGRDVFEKFVSFIADDKRNILAARPYFRERQDAFTLNIAPALKARKADGLYRHTTNYQFVTFAIRSCDWGMCENETEIRALAVRIGKVRTEIIEMNMPLAINRARIFWRCTPKSVLTFMDLVQISSDGLMSAVDKFVLPFSKSFRDVIIGRAVGNLIEHYSQTMLHFYPADKRKLYRANKALRKVTDSVDFEELAEKVNLGAAATQHTNATEIADLVSASSCVSLDIGVSSAEDPDKQLPGTWAVASEETRPDVQVEKMDTYRSLATAVAKLNWYEQKLLRLRGVDLG